MQKRSKILLTISLVMWVFFHSAWLFFGRETFELAQSFIIYSSSLVMLIEFKNKILEVFHVLGLNQLADELFFNPFEFAWNEYLTVGVLLLLIFSPISLIGLINILISKIQRK